MKKLLVGFFIGALFASQALGQSAIIRGELTPGSYVNIKADSNGNLLTAPGAGSTGGGGATFSQVTQTVTNTSGTLAVANTARKYLQIQNKDTAGIVYVNFGATATTANTQILPGQTWTMVPAPTNQVNAIGSIASNANVVVVLGE